jgi:hypothetical protein
MRAAILADLDTRNGQGFEPTSSPRLNVTVIHTSEEGTIAALAAAAQLAKNLCAHIRLLAPEVVPFHFSLARPHVTADFLEHRLYRLVCDAGIADEEVTVQVSLCRSSRRALAGLLAPHSLLVIASTHWWRREQRMERWLRQQGHHVVSVGAADGKRQHADTDRGRQAAYYRSVGLLGLDDLR